MTMVPSAHPAHKPFKPVRCVDAVARRKGRRPRPIARPRPRPADSWPSWTDSERWTISDPEPTADPDLAATSPEDEAYYLGFRLGLDGEYPAPVAFDPALSSAFYCGRLAGFAESPAGREWAEDMARWRDVSAAGPMTDRDNWPLGCAS